MKPLKNVFLTALALAAFSAGAWAQTSASTPPAQPITAADVQALKDALAAQQQLIERLTSRLDKQEAKQEAEQEAKQQAQQPAAETAAQLAPQQAVVYRLLAIIYLRQKNYPDLLSALNSYIQLDPGSAAGKRAQELRLQAEKELSNSPQAEVAIK